MDPNTTLVFQTIGLIKKSLQCSICLDLLNDPHSTRCNHQFCSCCIRKVVDERKDKKQEALCPLCKNPITKRSLTSNPRLNEIVDVVKRLNNAFQEDAAIPDSPYPLVNSKLNGQSFLKFSRLNPTPLKPVVFKSPKSDGLRTEEQLNSSVNHLHSFNTSQCSRKQTWLDKSLSPPKVLSREQRNSRPFEILSLLESEENSETEQPTTCIGKEVDQNDNPLQENCGNTNLATTRRSSPSTPYQTKNNQENVNSDNRKSSGSSTIDVGKSSQSGSILSDNSVSILDGLLSQQSRDKVVVQDNLEHVDVEVPGVETEKLCHSLTSNTRNILKSLQEDNDDIEQKEFLGNKHEFGGTPDVDGNGSKQSPSAAKGVNGIVTTKPKIARSKSVQSPGFSNSVERTPDQYSSERVPASVDSDSQSYNVIPLPLYQSDDMISPEFPRLSSHGVLVGQDNDNCEINPTDDNISSESKLCLFSEKEGSRGELIQTEQPEVRHAGNIYAPEKCGNSEASRVSQSKSENSARRQKCKRKHRDTNEGSAEFSSPCSCPTISGAKKKISSDENIDPTVEEMLSQDELCLPSECDLIRNKQTKAALSVESLQNSENSKHSEASIISPSPSGRSFRNRQFKRKRSAEDNNSLTKFPRFNGEMGVSEISVENHRKAYEHGSDKSGLKNIVSKHASCSSQEASKKTSNNLRIKMDVSEVNDLPVDPRPKANRSDDSEDDIIPPTPPDVGCAPCKKASTSMIKVQSPAVRGHAYKDDVGNDNDGGGDEKLFGARSNKLAKIRKRQCEVELADQDDCFDENYDDKETSKLQTNDTSGKIPVWENEEVHAPDNVLKHDACRDEGEVMNASNEGECPIIDDDQMYSSQEDLNVALLRRLAPDSASHKGSDNETESDDETSDCKNTDTTSISSLTDADGVEVSSQRIKYLHEVLAQTGGEIEKLTTDLKNLRQSEVNVQPNKLKNNHSDFDKNDSGLKINKENFDDDSSSDKEEEKVCDFDKESDTRDSHQGSSSEKENENSDTSDVENNVTKREAAANFNDQDNESNVTCKNKDSKAFPIMYDVPSEKDQIESDGESAEEDGVTKNDHVPDNYESDGENYNNHDDEIMERCSLSPPPALDHSLIRLTKLPPAIKNLKKMLQQDGDSEEEQDNSNYVNSSRDPFRKTLSELQKLFRKNPSSHITDVQDVPNHRSRDPRMSHPDSLQRTDMPKNNQLKKTESRNESSQKENSAEIKQRSVSRNKFQENYKNGNNVQKTGESSDGVLTEVRANTVSKQRTLTSMFGNSLNHEIKKAIQISKPSPCFVITRLPKQFVSLAGYLAKRNGGKMSDDVSEETTHIIMPTDSNMQASRKNYTIKYLLGIALGKWIVSQHWITACVKSGRLIDEKHYEVKGDVEAAQSHVPNLARITCENKSPLLFDGISVVCFGKFSGAISRVQLCQLVQYCGGKLMDFSYELLAGRMISDLIIICDSTLSEKRGMQIKDLCERYRTFPVSAEWVTDSVANYQLQDIEEYSMGI